MLRGFRWQLLALIAAVLLFGVALLNRQDVPVPVLQESTATAEPAFVGTDTPVPTPNPGVVIPPPSMAGNIPTMREGLVGSIQRLNPLLATETEQNITSLIFEGLVRTNPYGEPVPALAREWVVSSDGLEYIVTLRDDVLWQDGVPFSAADVDFTMALLRSANLPVPAEKGRFWRTVETEVLGEHLVRFRLTQPLGSFLDKLRIGILPAHALAGTPADRLATHPFNLTPIGTGPYQLEAVRAAGLTISQVDLRVAPVFRLRPEGRAGYGVDRLSFQIYPDFDTAFAALTSGNLDGLVGRDYSERVRLLAAAAGGRLNIHTTVDPVLGILIFNWQRDETRFFREQRVRLALETGMDRTSTIERRLLNRAIQANSPLWPGSWAYAADLPWPPHDLNTARFLLETANLGQRNDEGGEADENADTTLLRFSILTPEDSALVEMLQEFAVQWSQLNVAVTVEPVNPETYERRLEAGDFDAALVELDLGDSADPDVYPFWHQGQYPDGLNFGGVDDPRISELLERARRDPSGINRAELYREFQQDFVERAIGIPLYYPLFTYVTMSSIQGVQLGFVGAPPDRFMNIGDWYINQG
jgi:peptide/nickel transport system substrate-binding protein